MLHGVGVGCYWHLEDRPLRLPNILNVVNVGSPTQQRMTQPPKSIVPLLRNLALNKPEGRLQYLFLIFVFYSVTCVRLYD